MTVLPQSEFQRYNIDMKIFMSYARADQMLAEEIRAALTHSGYLVWNGESEILPGDNWAHEIGDALESCDAMVVLVSQAAMSSDNVRREINYALGASRYAQRLIPVMVEPVNELPWILKHFPAVPLESNREHLTARIISILEAAPV